jgi:hypothetical protein
MTMATPPPSKTKQNQDAATLSQSQPSTSEEIQARVDTAEAEGHIATPDLQDDATQREKA